jgi:hypothetical protein
MYPILDLTKHKQDLHWYLRCLEEVIIRALAETSGLQGERVEGLTGVWVDGAKLAAIGIRARKWVTYHGLALNVTTDLQPFRQIVPCGITDKPVGSVQTVLGAAAGGVRQQQQQEQQDLAAGKDAKKHPQQQQQEAASYEDDPFAPAEDVDEAVHVLHSSLQGLPLAGGVELTPLEVAGEVGYGEELLLEYRYALLDAFEEVFGVRLIEPSADVKAEADIALGVASLPSQEGQKRHGRSQAVHLASLV